MFRNIYKRIQPLQEKEAINVTTPHYRRDNISQNHEVIFLCRC